MSPQILMLQTILNATVLAMGLRRAEAKRIYAEAQGVASCPERGELWMELAHVC